MICNECGRETDDEQFCPSCNEGPFCIECMDDHTCVDIDAELEFEEFIDDIL